MASYVTLQGQFLTLAKKNIRNKKISCIKMPINYDCQLNSRENLYNTNTLIDLILRVKSQLTTQSQTIWMLQNTNYDDN